MGLRYALAPAVTGTAAPCIPQAKAWGATYAATPSAAHTPLLDLSQGVPGEPPHPSVLEALARQAGDPEAAKYGPILGEPAMREALAGELRELYRLREGDLTGADVGITTGCNMAFLVLLMCLCPPHTSSILLPLPSYFNHAMSLSLQSVEPAYLPCDPSDGFGPSIEAARAILAAGPQTRTDQNGSRAVHPRAIVLVTPNNPTGSVYSPARLREWLALAREYNVPLVLDETYRDFAGERGAPHGLFGVEGWRESLITLGSFSKGYRIPGHRLGSITASPTLLQQVATVCDCMQICPPRAPQLALAPLLPSLRPDMARYAAALRARLAAFGEVVEGAGWRVLSSGGFYAYVEFPAAYVSEAGRRAVEAALGRTVERVGSGDVGEVLATKCGVLTLPGCFFMPDREDPVWAGVPGGDAMREDRWIRFAVANVSDETIAGLGERLRMLNAIMGM